MLTDFRDVLERNKGIKFFSVGDNSLGDEGLAALAAGFVNNHTIEKWDLAFKSLSSVAGKIVADMGQANSSLVTLDLSRNALGDEGVRQLCHGLSAGGLMGLRTLDLGR